MPSVDDVFNQLVDINTRLQQIHVDNGNLINATNNVKGAVDLLNVTLNAGFTNLSTGIVAIIKLHEFTNDLLLHNDKQNDTIICTLNIISKNICSILNEEHNQTELQIKIENSVDMLHQLYETVHPNAHLSLEKLKELEEQIQKCCPPARPEPICKEEACKLDSEIKDGPKIEYPPFRPMQGDDVIR